MIEKAPINPSKSEPQSRVSERGAALATSILILGMLGAIAILPLWKFAHHWWESNLHKFYTALALAIVTVFYFAFLHPHPIVGHFPAHHLSEVPEGEVVHVGTVVDLLANALLKGEVRAGDHVRRASIRPARRFASRRRVRRHPRRPRRRPWRAAA